MNNEIKIKACVFLLNQKGEVLLIKEKYEKNRDYLWNIITGTYESSKDKTIYDTAIREIKEETTVTGKLTGYVGTVFLNKTDKSRIYFLFTARILNSRPRIPKISAQVGNNESITMCKWFTKDEVKKLQLNDMVSEASYEALRLWLNMPEIDLLYVKNLK